MVVNSLNQFSCTLAHFFLTQYLQLNLQCSEVDVLFILCIVLTTAFIAPVKITRVFKSCLVHNVMECLIGNNKTIGGLNCLQVSKHDI